MAKEITEIRSIGSLFQDSWKLFTKIWLQYFVYYVATFLGMIVLMGAVLGYPVAKLVTENPNLEDITPEMFMSNWPYILIAVVVFTLFAAYISLAMSKTIYTIAQNKEISYRESLSYSGKNFIKYLWVSVVTGLLVVLGFILLVIPGFYALTILSLVPIIFVIEENYSLDALKRSRELVSKNFWGVFGRLFLLFILLSVASGLFKDAHLIQTIINFVTGALSLGYVYYMYLDLAKK